MKKLKNIFLISFFSVMLAITGIFITSCKDQSPEVVITSSTQSVELTVGREEVVTFRVENFQSDGSVVLSTFDNSISSDNKQSGHIKFEAHYKGSGLTEVVISGTSGGMSTLVATSSEGSKVASIIVKVNEYSTSLSAKEEKLYLSEQSQLIPTSDYFIFSDQTTIKNLNYYYILNSNAISNGTLSTNGTISEEGTFRFEQSNSNSILETKEFVSAKLNSETREVTFTQSSIDLENNNTTFKVSVNDTAKLYFIAEYENISSGTSYYAITYFTVFLGIDKTAFKVTKDSSEKTESTLITYNSANLSKDNFTVEIPYYNDSDNLEFDYEISEEDLKKISLSSTYETDLTRNKRIYNFELVSRVAYKTTAKIDFKLYYKGYKDADDDLISQTKTIDVTILVAPNEIRVNDLKEDNPNNSYVFYNSNIGDYGWQEFNISVYAEDSSYTGALIDFNSNQIEVKSGSENLWPGRMIVDLSTPLMVRGSGSATASEGVLKITLKSPVFDIATSINEITYDINFIVKEGATELKFINKDYEYSQTSQNNGIYVSNSLGNQVFTGIYADRDFSYANIIYQTEDRFVEVSYVGKEEVEGKYFLKLNVVAKEVGIQTVNVVLDNGRSILATFRVVDTFDNITINQNTTNADNNGTISVTKYKKDEKGDDVGLNVVIRNSYEKNDQYDRACSILISSNNGTDVINSINYNTILNDGVVSVIEGRKGNYILRTLTYGESSIEFVCLGQAVKDFMLNEVEKNVIVDIVSYNPVSSLELINSEDVRITSLALFVAENSAAVKPTTLKVKANGNDTFSFYNQGNYIHEKFSEEFVTYTATEDIYNPLTGLKVDEQMKYGETYNIGNFALFDTKTRTLTALKANGNFTLFANVRQYEWSMSYALNVRTYEYDTVESLTTNLNVKDQTILFKQSETSISFIVNVNPKDATNLNIKILKSEYNGSVPIIQNPKISKINNGSYLVTLDLNQDVLSTTEKVGCTLTITAEDWLSSDNTVSSLYESSVLTYEVVYQNGTEENPFILSSAEDVIEIGKSVSGMNAYYKISGYIDMSKYSNKLPLGTENDYVFNGTILGSNNATIAGLNIESGKEYNSKLYYGLFAELGEKARIENVTFEGKFDIELSEAKETYVGLIAGINNSKNVIDANEKVTYAGLNNISVVLSSSNIKVKGSNGVTIYIGGVVGQNLGEITRNYNDSTENVYVENKTSTNVSMPTVISNDVLNISSENSKANIYAGGIAGLNGSNGKIADLGMQSDYGYSGYMTYTLISLTNSNLEKAYIGAISGDNSGMINGGIVGGKVETDNNKAYVGGISGSHIGKIGIYGKITVRTFVRGYNVGLITAKRGNGSGTKNIIVQATDDGESINEDASMIVRYDTSVEINDSNAISYALVNSDGFTDDSISLVTYVSRGYIQTFASNTNSYIGDFIVLDISSTKTLKFQEQFQKGSTTAMSIEAKEDFIELKLDPENINKTEKMYMMYYFEAAEYLVGDKFTSAEISEIQAKLDKKYNIVSRDSVLFPFELKGENLTISSVSDIVKVDSKQNLILSGTGVAKLIISNILDARKSQVVYLYVVNYFNYKAIKQNQSFFMLDDIRLSDGESTASIYSNSNTIIDISAIYETSNGLRISDDATLNIENFIVKLKKDISFIEASIIDLNKTDPNKTDPKFEDHADYVISNDMIIFTKKANVSIPKDVSDRIELATSISVSVDDIMFVFNNKSNPKVTFKYYEGVTNVLSNYDSYTTSTSGRITDEITIVSDDNNENLSYIITKDNKEIQTSNTEDGLFNVKLGNCSKSDGIVKYPVEISVNKSSSIYHERFTNNIFGKYTIRYFGNSNQNNVYREVDLTLTDEYLESIVIDNYVLGDVNEENITKSSRVIPAKYGLLSVTVSPSDVDFTSFELTNGDINYTQGSSYANFEVGYMTTSGSVEFKRIDGATYNSKGFSISKTELVEKIPNYDGQFYIRYIFANSSSVKDSSRVDFNVKLRKNSEELYSDVLTYSIYKKFVFDITIDNKQLINKNSQTYYHVARGVRYKLNIENSGYDTNSITLNTSDSSLASITNENGVYYLNIAQRALDYTTGGISFKVQASASRIDARGELITTSPSFECKIMEYVINYVPTSEDKKFDIIKGMNNGNLVVALGTENSLAVDFSKAKYIEYNESLSSVLVKVSNLMTEATNKGIWRVYTDIDQSISDEIGRKNEGNLVYEQITSSAILENKYFTFKGLNYVTNSEHDPLSKKHYVFTYEALFNANEETGVYNISTDGLNHQEQDNYLYSEFSIISYIRGSEKAPNPIRDYSGLKGMGYNGHYILTNDIHITPETFEPINISFASLDGNGYSVIFDPGEYDVSNYSNVGIFSDISSSSIVKNLKVVIGGDENHVVRFTTTASTSTTIGLVAARNSGSITNARVIGATFDAGFNSSSTPSAGSYVAGITAYNSGAITNSQVMASITTNVSVAGLVGINNGTIASSYYKGGFLTNTSEVNTKFYTAGLVISNSENGKILTSYSSGDVSSTYIYSYRTYLSKIVSRVQTAGAVYSNYGTIQDSYSNIPLDTTSSCAGFVYENAGKIERCFSTSIIIHDHNQRNYYFVGFTNIAGDNGTQENCYYLKDATKTYLTSENSAEHTGINQSLASDIVEGVVGLIAESNDESSGFNDLANFTTYAYGASPLAYNNVWMFIQSGQNVSTDVFKQTVITTSSDTGKYISSAYRDQVFAGGRLELVSSNILATSYRVMDESKTTVEDGITTYFYEYKVNNEGSLLNPYIISSPELFESYMTSENNSTESNGYFRLISDLNYSNFEGNISTQNISLYGIIEGNGLTVRNIEIAGSDGIESAGWIGKVSGSYGSVAGVMNLTIVPKVVNFPNASIVGTLVGTLDNASAENIEVLSALVTNAIEEIESITVSGKNVTGGVVGLVKNNSNLRNLTSTVGAKASYVPSDTVISDGIYTESTGNISGFSYAGGAVGYVYTTSGRKAVLSDIVVKGTNSYIIGNKAGFVFGGLSSNVDVSRVKVVINSDMLINAYTFGGLIVGESAATMSDVVVSGTKDSLNVFSTSSYIPTAVGGVVGYMLSGNISNVYMGQSFEVAVSQDKTIEYVGGIAGYVNSTYSSGEATISRTIVDATILARNLLGGVVGYAETRLNLSEVAVYKHTDDPEKATLTLEGELANAYVGGFVGRASDRVKIENSYSLATIKIDTYVYNVATTANIGAIIGSWPTDVTNQLSYVYTITTYVVNLENKKVAKPSQNVTISPEDDKTILLGGEVIEQVSYNQKHDVIPENTLKPAGTTKEQAIANARNRGITVFNFMGTKEKSELSNETKFTARTDKTLITLNQNELGYNIASYYAEVNGTSGETAQPRPNLAMYYGLMPDSTEIDEDKEVVETVWYNSRNTNGKYNNYPTLKFESEIKKS